ncbi:proline--tRNA ligase [Patescibacteria group bacterium]|nr:proline--tRNA ligase [Patescibacteria group bacterium]MBU1663588.1 proline--tRNA ligase [Patescibacteria group bacterium]MBU1934135.1 proline--tRNA ligase [Patescibacteria group bacterium]MBU2233999.1 proline--tRNA ligase [Patescibacteria group bacterium]
MKYSKLFGRTTKTVSNDMKLASNKFLHQAGFIRESVAGRYYYLPMGMIVRDKVVKIIQEEMDKSGAQKMLAPILHPLELWEKTNRTELVSFELIKVKDRNNSEFALGGTAEEMIVDLVQRFNISYNDLPFHIYQFSTKFRDELRARGGLLRLREFLMKDGYSFHANEADFKKEYEKMKKVYSNIFKRMGLKTLIVESDNGYIGGEYCHEFIVESHAGESHFFYAKDGSYAAHEDAAKFLKQEKNVNEKEKKLIEVKAPRGNTMADGVKFHKLPLWLQIKDVMFVDEKGRFILAIIRGDLNVNETKLKNIIKAVELRHATDEEIRKLDSEPGFISPVGISKKVLVVADDSLRTIKNAYGGSNKKDIDLFNVNIDQDYQPNLEGDIATAEQGFLSQAGKKLFACKGIEAGNIFQLGYHYSKKMKAYFTDKDGKEKLYYMGCYGIGIDRTIAAIVEKHHDDNGIIWPEAVAPFKAHLIALGKDEKIYKQAEEIYEKLLRQGMEVLHDDRVDVMAGEKFADADLIGLPLRIVISEKSLKVGGAEIKRRDSKKNEIVKIDNLDNNFILRSLS